MASIQRPAILVICTAAVGHITPLCQITAYLTSRGHDIWFTAWPEHRRAIEASGAKFIAPTPPFGSDIDQLTRSSRYTDPKDWDLCAFLRENWVGKMPSSLETIRHAMSVVRRSTPSEREVVMMVDCFVPGIVPLKMGAALPEGYTKLPKTLGISVIPPMFTSIDQGPSAMGLPYDKTHSVATRTRNVMLGELLKKAWGGLSEDLQYILRTCGVYKDIGTVFGDHSSLIFHNPLDAGFVCHDTTLQMCIPSLEYDVTDWPANIKFGGTLPPKPQNANLKLPDWYNRVLENSAKHCDSAKTDRRKIVVTVQGTVAQNYEACIVPAIRGLASRADVLVVAILGRRGANLADAFPDGVPENTIVSDYFPYDPVLRHADLLITNGSYGVLTHCVVNGVPMVTAGGVSEDKPEVGGRVEYSGLGINLRDPLPSSDTIARAAQRILDDPKYMERALQLKAESEAFGCLETVERELTKLFK